MPTRSVSLGRGLKRGKKLCVAALSLYFIAAWEKPVSMKGLGRLRGLLKASKRGNKFFF